LLMLFVLSVILGPMLISICGCCTKRPRSDTRHRGTERRGTHNFRDGGSGGACFGTTMSFIAHTFAVFNTLIAYLAVSVLSNGNIGLTLFGILTLCTIQRALFRLLTILFLTREFPHPGSNSAWWDGRWLSKEKNLGWRSCIAPGRELICKVLEMSAFAADWIGCHWVLFMVSMRTGSLYR
jgi:hypothetical protein